jgi:thymidylate synthase ThyX
LRRAEELYDRVFLEYGDDSVAQLGGVHLACEQASNVLTKILEWGRLMAYLEQSTRYIPYDSRLGGLYRYFRPPEVLRSRFGARYVGDLDALFDSYASSLPRLMDWARERFPKEPGDSDFVYKQTIKARRRSLTSASTAPASRSRRCCCACAPIRCPRRVPTRR